MIRVNLLPEDIKKEIAQAKKNRKLVRLYIRLVLILFITCLVLGGSYLYFQTKINSSSSNYAEKEKLLDRYGNLEDDSKKVAGKLETIKQINRSTNSWSGIINEINQVVPNGVYLTGIKIDSNPKMRNQITGYALSKSNVASFQQALEKSEVFQYVDIEISQTQVDPSSTEERENFTISFSLEKGALK